MALQGNLADLPLIDLMQVLTIQRKTGILTLIQSFSQAQIAFTQSRLYSAFLWHMTSIGREVHTEGVAAIHELMDWSDGQFTFELTDLLPPVENIDVPLDYVILEHYRLSDEQKRLEAETIWADLRPRLVDQPPEQGDIMLTMDELRVLLLVNGLLSIRDIAGMTQQETLKTIEVSRELARRGLIKIPRPTQPLALVEPAQIVIPSTYQDYRQSRQAVPETTEPVALLNPPLEVGNNTPVLPLEIFMFEDDEPETQELFTKFEPDYPSLDFFEMAKQVESYENPQVLAKPEPLVKPLAFARQEQITKPLVSAFPESPALPVAPAFAEPAAKPKAPPMPDFYPKNPEVVAPPPFPRGNAVVAALPEPRASLNWQDKSPVEESLRPKVKKGLLGSIMAKIRGL